MTDFGYKVVERPNDNLRWILSASPTGRNILLGSDAEYVFASDPTGTVGSWPDGARGIWPISATELRIGRYTRATGWRSASLT